MRLRELVNCHGCLRATREWSEFVATTGGRPMHKSKLCRACLCEVDDALQRRVRELRGAAVSRW